MRIEKGLLFLIIFFFLFTHYPYISRGEEVSDKTETTAATLDDSFLPDIEKDYKMGEYFLEQGKYLKAINHFTRVLVIDPIHKKAQEGLKEAEAKFLQKDESSTVTSTLPQALPLPTNIEQQCSAYLEQANEALLETSYIKALEFFSKVLALNPESTEAKEGFNRASKAVEDEKNQLRIQSEKSKIDNQVQVEKVQREAEARLQAQAVEFKQKLQDAEKEWQQKQAKLLEENTNQALQNKINDLQARLGELQESTSRQVETAKAEVRQQLAAREASWRTEREVLKGSSAQELQAKDEQLADAKKDAIGLRKELAGLRDSLAQSQKELVSLKEGYAKGSAQKEKTDKRLKELEGENVSLKQQLSQSVSAGDKQYKDKLKDLETRLVLACQEKDALNKSYADLSKGHAQLSAQVNRQKEENVNLQKRLQEAAAAPREDVNELNKVISDLKGQLKASVSELKVSRDELNAAKRGRDEIDVKLQNALAQTKKTKGPDAQLASKIKVIEGEKDALLKQIQAFAKKEEQQSSTIASLNTQLANVKGGYEKELEEQKKKLGEDRDRLSKEYEGRLQKLQDKVTSLEKEGKILQAKWEGANEQCKALSDSLSKLNAIQGALSEELMALKLNQSEEETSWKKKLDELAGDYRASEKKYIEQIEALSRELDSAKKK